ncbi:aldose epimerase family protein [Salinisphaera sp. Q1T1-3]|uniref:aldose epimerase family protein n=1 Tax=Salinisphaera sp. Q1T1-3 TaxID=2321229 RepID=UPI000E73841B|nr:aldose epimerase family protein [Salinisphaera sp. Q1T1-3]RJS93025.1 galactose mutarotase [Salinisphaera sp. Q1T1-3]
MAEDRRITAPLALSVSRRVFGRTPDDESVDCYTLTNRRGMTVDILTYGARIHRLCLPDMHGEIADVALGFDDLEGYTGPDDAYFGATIGRFANRIAGGHFTLDDQAHQLSTNENGNTLHGGERGFDSRVWAAAPLDTGNAVGVELTLLSPAGEMGFPGTLAVTLRYTLDDENRLSLHYSAVCDAPTVINLTNHLYLNLAGATHGDILDHAARLNASRYTPVDDALIPTGRIAPVAGTALDFTRPRRIGQAIADRAPELAGTGGGYDFNWVLDSAGDIGRLAARVADADSGRAVELYTSEPGVQFYTSNNLNGEFVGKSGVAYPRYAGFTLEAQRFPDAPNQPGFPGGTVLRPGEKYTQNTTYKFLPELTPRSSGATHVYDAP